MSQKPASAEVALSKYVTIMGIVCDVFIVVLRFICYVYKTSVMNVLLSWRSILRVYNHGTIYSFEYCACSAY